MACSCSINDSNTFISDMNEFLEDCKEFETAPGPGTLLMIQEDKTIQLPRGGCVIQTQIGPIQYGIPPETVKDSLNMGIEVPTYYILPKNRFDRRSGVNVAEFQFPAYFNFFVKNRKITLICTKEVEQSIRTIFQETLLGPLTHEQLHQDFPPDCHRDHYPDFHQQRSVFSKNPKNPNKPLTVDMLLSFVLYDEQTETATINANGVQIEVSREENNEIHIYENGAILEKIFDSVNLQSVEESGKLEETAPALSEAVQRAKQKNPTLNNVRRNSQMPMVIWNEDEIRTRNISYLELNISSDSDAFQFSPPDFGVTLLGTSHGFDPQGSTTGMIIWIYGRGIMVDPPPFSTNFLRKNGIASSLIYGIIISHCHADHDAGTFHKILDENRLEVITTRTIMGSFLRKYSAVSGISKESLSNLFAFRPAIIGKSMHILGARFQFFYSFHTIPCIGFKVKVMNKSIYFSGDTFYDPIKLKDYVKEGIMTETRYKNLAHSKFDYDIILHEAGVPPIHTPQTVLGNLSSDIKNRLYLVHVAEKDVLQSAGLKVAKCGVENTMILHAAGTNKALDFQRRLDLLCSIDLFDTLNIQNIKSLMDSLAPIHFKPKDIVVAEGSIGYDFYIVENGIAKIYSNSSSVNKFQRYVSTGDYFGETALIVHNGKRLANVVAITELKLLQLEIHDFWFIFGDGQGGDGPFIKKFRNLTDVRKSNSINIINKNYILNDMGPSQKIQFELILKEKQVQKGDIMWQVGDQPKFAFLVKKGGFEFFDCPETKDVDELESGSFIGEAKAFIEGTPLTTNIQAVRSATIFLIQKDDLIQFLNQNPGLWVTFEDVQYITDL